MGRSGDAAGTADATGTTNQSASANRDTGAGQDATAGAGQTSSSTSSSANRSSDSSSSNSSGMSSQNSSSGSSDRQTSSGSGMQRSSSQWQSCPATASTTNFGLVTKDGQVMRFDDVGNTRAQQELKNHPKWTANNNKPANVKVRGVATGDTVQVLEIK